MRRCLAVLLSLVPLALCAAERVLDFHTELRVSRDGGLWVTEILTVQSDGGRVRGGVERDLALPLEHLTVTRNGRPLPFERRPVAGGLRIHMRDASAVLQPGQHEYRIAYRTAHHIGFFEHYDELTWKVNGSGATLPVERLSAEVRLPEPVPAGELKAQARTGPPGAQGRDYQAFVRPGSAAFRATRPLAPREAFTIAVAFPKGVVRQPNPGERLAAWVDRQRMLALGLAALLILAVDLALLTGFLRQLRPCWQRIRALTSNYRPRIRA
jgi:hypothetical protein